MKRLALSLIMFLIALLILNCGSEVPTAPVSTTDCFVTFNSQSATIEASPNVKSVAKNTALGSLPTNPSKTSYTFSGWFTQTNGLGTQFTESTVVTGDLTVYAKWNSGAPAYSYTVTFNGDGATTPASPTSKTVTDPATNVGTLPAEPLKTGYSFGGWFTGTNGTGTQFTASTTVTGNITVYAKWTAVYYTVTYDPNGAVNGMNPGVGAGTVPAQVVVQAGTTITVSANTGNLVRFPAAPSAATPSLAFLYWTTVPSGAATGYGPGYTTTITVNSNITLYARWRTLTIGDTGPAGGKIVFDAGNYDKGIRYYELEPLSNQTTGTWGSRLGNYRTVNGVYGLWTSPDAGQIWPGQEVVKTVLSNMVSLGNLGDWNLSNVIYLMGVPQYNADDGYVGYRPAGGGTITMIAIPKGWTVTIRHVHGL